MFAFPVPQPFLAPFVMLQQYNEMTQALLRAFRGMLLPSAAYAHNRSLLQLQESQQSMLALLMQPVKRTRVPGQYAGAMMEMDRTRLAADMSGDHNDVHVNPHKPHPLFGKPIAHGMDAVTQAFAALRHDVNGSGLVPRKVDIGFRQPVFLGEDRLRIHVAPATPDTPEREIDVYAHGKKSSPEKLVVRMRVGMENNVFPGERAWFHLLMSGWRISALLAETWPGCLYTRQLFDFHQPMDGNQLGTYVRGEGKNDKGHCTVYTQAHESGRSVSPAVSGKATIVLPTHH